MFTPLYRIRWERPTGSWRLHDTVWATYTEYDSPPIACWTKDPGDATLYFTRADAEQDRQKRCDMLAINPMNPTLSLEEHTDEQEDGQWVPSP